MISHGCPVRNGITSPSHRKVAVFLKFLDFATPKAKHHNNDHSNCQCKNGKEGQSGEPVPVSFGPIGYLPGFSEAPVQLLTHCFEFASCGFSM